MTTELILQYLLPKELFDYFELLKIEEQGNTLLHLYLDEKAVIPEEYADKDLVSNGFDEAITIQDFPLRDKAVYLIVRRRKWKDKATGKIYCKKWDLTANGSRYSKEFAAFLKELY
jgi:hypothetical protein